MKPHSTIHTQRAIVTAILATALLLTAPLSVRADEIPAGWAASNMTAIGYSGLNGIGESFKLAIKQVNGRWYLYMGHFAHPGWTILDVTDPTKPTVAKFIPGPPNTTTFQVDLHDNIMITALARSSANWGGDEKKPSEEGIFIWDISNPVDPKRITHWKTGSGGTHRNGYPGGKYAYLTASQPEFQGRILLILDISDQKRPKEAGRWWMPGQKKGETATGPVGGLHGPAMVDGSRVYLGWGRSVVVLDTSDISSPKLVGRLDFPALKGVHDVLPIPGKPMLFAHSEGIAGDTPASTPCDEPLNFSGMIDIKDPTKPRLMSMFPTPVPPKGLPYSNFCDKGGRFGPHNTNLEYHLPDVEKTSNLIYVTYFNAGLRIFDIQDPRQPTEVGWFIPPTPTKRGTPIPSGTLVNQTEDVLVDTRGNIYITDKQWGVFILRYTGKGAPAPTATASAR